MVELIQTFYERKIPMLIFSAGIADVLEEVIKVESKRSTIQENVSVVSNRCIFGGSAVDRRLVGFEDPVFHVFNKKGVFLFLFFVLLKLVLLRMCVCARLM